METRIIIIIAIIIIAIALIITIMQNRGDAAQYTGGDESDFNFDTHEFVLNPNLKSKNASGQIVKFYNDQLAPDAQPIANEIKPKIATMNVHFFSPINIKIPKSQCVRAVFDFMDEHALAFIALQEVPVGAIKTIQKLAKSNGFYCSEDYLRMATTPRRASLVNLVISRYPLEAVKITILPNDPQYESRYRHAIVFRVKMDGGFKHKTICATHLEIAERDDCETGMRIRKTQLRFIKDNINPDFMLGDFNFNPGVDEQRPEFIFACKWWRTADLAEMAPTTPFGTIVDFVWARNSDRSLPFSAYSANYPYSDHRPVVAVFDN